MLSTKIWFLITKLGNNASKLFMLLLLFLFYRLQITFFSGGQTSWRASEVSEPLSGLFNRESQYIYIYTIVTMEIAM